MDNKNVAKLDVSNKYGKYELERIWNRAVYARESKSDHLSGLYYLGL